MRAATSCFSDAHRVALHGEFHLAVGEQSESLADLDRNRDLPLRRDAHAVILLGNTWLGLTVTRQCCEVNPSAPFLTSASLHPPAIVESVTVDREGGVNGIPFDVGLQVAFGDVEEHGPVRLGRWSGQSWEAYGNARCRTLAPYPQLPAREAHQSIGTIPRRVEGAPVLGRAPSPGSPGSRGRRSMLT